MFVDDRESLPKTLLDEGHIPPKHFATVGMASLSYKWKLSSIRFGPKKL